MLLIPASPACRSLLLLLPRAPIPLLVLALDLQLSWIYRGWPWRSLILFANLVIIAPLAAVTE